VIPARGRWFVIVCLAMASFVTTGCDFITDSSNTLDPQARALVPPARFETMWRTVQACTGLRGEFSSLEFYSVPSGYRVNGKLVDGFWENRGWHQRIYLTNGLAATPETVRHEMVHALIQTAQHTRRDFVENCGGIVACTSSCRADAGVTPYSEVEATSLPLLVNASMVQGIRIIPSERSDSAWFTIIVSAQNPAGQRSSLPTALQTFAYTMGTNGGTQNFGSEFRILDGHQTVQAAFDVLPSANERGRRFTVTGQFNGVNGASTTIDIP
jgi:hypothetical protein